MSESIPQLREALELWESYLAGIHDCNLEEPEAVAVLHINAAARCLVEVAETSEEVEWCDEHGSRFLEKHPDELSMCLWMLHEDNWDALPEPDPCRIVSRRLVDPQQLPGDDDE